MAKKQSDKKGDLEKLSFEQAIELLTGIVDRIETGQVPLAESLEQYEKGMILIKHCRAILQDAEKRIENIADDGDETDENEIEDSESDTENDEPDNPSESEDDSLF